MVTNSCAQGFEISVLRQAVAATLPSGCCHFKLGQSFISDRFLQSSLPEDKAEFVIGGRCRGAIKRGPLAGECVLWIREQQVTGGGSGARGERGAEDTTYLPCFVVCRTSDVLFLIPGIYDSEGSNRQEKAHKRQWAKCLLGASLQLV